MAMSPDGSQLFATGFNTVNQVRTETIHAYTMDPVDGTLTEVTLADED